jgi:DNA-binding transcriptional LysR family regulator
MDAITLEQLRAFVAVVEEGSFSAAARRTHRVQSAVSQAMAALEHQLGHALFDRTGRTPTLTARGRVLLVHARRVTAQVEELKAVAHGFDAGLEPGISLVVDALFPVRALTAACRDFLRRFPMVPLRLHTETLNAVAMMVHQGICQLGITGPAANTAGLEASFLTQVHMVPVVAADHPLAAVRGRIRRALLEEHVQVVLSERASGGATASPDQAVVSPLTWRVVDLATKHALLLGGLGWGNLPYHLVARDLAARRLVRIQPAAWAANEHVLSLSVVHRGDLHKGKATSWLLEHLATLCAQVETPTPRRHRGK